MRKKIEQHIAEHLRLTKTNLHELATQLQISHDTLERRMQNWKSLNVGELIRLSEALSMPLKETFLSVLASIDGTLLETEAQRILPAQSLSEFLQKEGIKKKRMAEVLGVSRFTWQHREENPATLQLEEVRKLALCLHISSLQLLHIIIVSLQTPTK